MLEELPFELLEEVFSNLPLTPSQKSNAYPDYRPGDEHEKEGNDLAIRLLQNRKTLQALCLVNSTCRTAARPFLYRDVILKDGAALPFFLRSILESPDAGDLARSLTILPAFGSLYATDSLRESIDEHLFKLEDLDGTDAPTMIKRGQFDWAIRLSNDNKTTNAQVMNRKRDTLRLVQSLKQRSLGVFRDKTSYWDCFMEIFLYFILRETPRIQRLLLQFPLNWGENLGHFEIFGRFYHKYSSSVPNFCSCLTEVVLSSASQPRIPDRRLRLRHAGNFPFRHFPSLNTLTIIGSEKISHLFAFERISSIRSLHLVDTTVSPRELAEILIKLPQDLTSLIYKVRANNPHETLEQDAGPEHTTLSEALRQKGSHLQELTLDFSYTACVANPIGPEQRLDSLVTLSRLERLTVQKHLLFHPHHFKNDIVLFGNPVHYPKIVLDNILPHNLVELNILEEFQIDIAERESWLNRFYQTDHIDYIDRRPSFLTLVASTAENDFRTMHSPKNYEVYAEYRENVEKMLLDLAANCGHGNKKFAKLTSVTYQVAPQKPLRLVPHDTTQIRDNPYDDGSLGGWFHQFPCALERTHWEPYKEEDEDPNEPAKRAVREGAFVCWIPYRWVDMALLRETFGRYDGEIGDGSPLRGYSPMSVHFMDPAVLRDHKQYQKKLVMVQSGDVALGPEHEGDDNQNENSERTMTKQYVTLWDAFRKIPREHFKNVTAAFEKSAVRFDCFGPESREWLMAIRDCAKSGVEKMVGVDDAKLVKLVVKEDL